MYIFDLQFIYFSASFITVLGQAHYLLGGSGEKCYGSCFIACCAHLLYEMIPHMSMLSGPSRTICYLTPI